ncbi:MAG: hypothetical protein PHV16_02195 [Candidatus Nanoarchaeia archaeon]|nr:hypothetical protein [Candidatus Nanoarchaeia archaeon]
MFFKKPKKEDDSTEAVEEEKNTPQNSGQDSMGEASIGRMTAEVEKLKAQFKTFYELQKASNERFGLINEQIGGLRTMIMDRDKDSRLVEAKATQAIDLVQTVQPDKLMMMVKKIENKIEMLKSPIETNEVIINNTIKEIKDMRTKINSFKGLDEAIKLSEEVKKGWMENKKIDADITKHSSKIETIYSEMWRQFSDLQRVSAVSSDLQKSLKQLSTETDSIKIKMTSLSTKKEVEELVEKFEGFEKHVNNVIATLNSRISTFDSDFSQKFQEKIERLDRLLRGFETLAMKTPDLDKYFNLLEEEAKKAPLEAKVEKLKELGEEEEVKETKKKSFFSKLKKKLKKSEESETESEEE